MIEPEMAYYDLDMNMDLAEEMVVPSGKGSGQHNREELEILERDISRLEQVKAPFPGSATPMPLPG
jgi:asparaginyl-tRNA synthetase